MKSLMFACQNPASTDWQLGHLPAVSGNLILIGWQIIRPPIDAGMPEPVARILAQAMTDVSRVVFPCSGIKPHASTGWRLIGDDLICTLKDNNLSRRAWNVLSGVPSAVELLSTRKPETAVRLFDDPVYPWWMQGQVALLCKPELAQPEIDKQNLFALFEDNWAEGAASLQKIGVSSVLRPSADGDAAGFLSVTESFNNALLTSIEKQSHSAEFGWELLSESDFARYLTGLR